MKPVIRPVQPVEPEVERVIKTDRQARAHATVLWGKDGFASAYHGKIGVRCSVGITSGSTKIVYANGCTWDEAFERAPAGEESYATILRMKTA